MSSIATAPTTRWTCDWCDARRLPQLQAFLHQHWRAHHVLSRDAELLTWQFAHADPERLAVVVAHDGDEIGGMLGCIQFPFCSHGRRTRGAWLSTWLVAPAYRGQGVGLRLLQWVMAQDYSFVGTLGGNAITMRILGAYRFALTQRLPRLVRVFSTEALAALLSSLPGSEQAVYRAAWLEPSHARKLPAGAAPADGPHIAHWSAEWAERWEQCWRRHLAPRMLGVWRDAEYLRRRYVEHPRYRYHVCFAADDAGEVTGLLVYRLAAVRDHSAQVLRIVEFLPVAGNATALVQQLLQVGSSAGVAYADFTCTSRAVAEPLLAAGFAFDETSRPSLPARLQPLDFQRAGMTGAYWCAEPGVRFEQAAELYFTGGDSDQDRPN